MMRLKGKKLYRSVLQDVFSNLPDNIIDIILMRLPCKEAVRTSILSKKWRYHWCRRTELTLDASLWGTKKYLLNPTLKFTKIIYQILSLHEGPLTRLTLDIANLEKCPDMNNFIYFLSRNQLQHLVLQFPRYNLYKLPSSIFSCSQLRHLTLHACLIHHPAAFKGSFDRLISLELCRVQISSKLVTSLISQSSMLGQLVLKRVRVSNVIEIDAPILKSFIFKGRFSSIRLKKVPLLSKLSLKRARDSPTEAENFNIAKFFESCSSLQDLLLRLCFPQILEKRIEEAPTRLSFDLKSVKRFYLRIILLEDSYNLSCVLCLMRSLPYLEYLDFEVYCEDDYGPVESLELERFSNVTFNHLKEVKLAGFTRATPEMQLIKLLLAKSPVLVKMLIVPCIYGNEDPDMRSDILDEISEFQHASSKAEVVSDHDLWIHRRGVIV